MYTHTHTHIHHVMLHIAQVCQASKEVPDLKITLQIIVCPACKDVYLVRPNVVPPISDEAPPSSDALIRLSDFYYTCSLRPVFQIVSNAQRALSLLPSSHEFCSCNELHLADT